MDTLCLYRISEKTLSAIKNWRFLLYRSFLRTPCHFVYYLESIDCVYALKSTNFFMCLPASHGYSFKTGNLKTGPLSPVFFFFWLNMFRLDLTRPTDNWTKNSSNLMQTQGTGYWFPVCGLYPSCCCSVDMTSPYSQFTVLQSLNCKFVSYRSWRPVNTLHVSVFFKLLLF